MTVESSQREELKGIGLSIIAAIAFGTLAIFAKKGYEAGAGLFPLLAVRFAITTAILAVVRAFMPSDNPTPRRRIRTLVLLGGIGYALESSLFFGALEYADASVVALVFYSYPLWTSVIALVSRLEPFRGPLLVALLLGTIGVSLVFSLPPTGLRGPILALSAAVSVAFYMIGLQLWTKGIDPVASALWTSFGAAVAFAIAAAIAQQPFPAEALGPAAALGVATAVAFVTLYAGIARIGSARASAAAMLEPVTTVVLGSIFLNDLLSWRIGVGAALIVSSLPVLALTTRKGGVAAPPTA